MIAQCFRRIRGMNDYHPLVGYRRQGPSLKKRRGNGELKIIVQIAKHCISKTECRT